MNCQVCPYILKLEDVMMEEAFLLFIKIMIINIVLSGDNAVVIAMASKNLPIHQRRKAVAWGSFGAVILRLLLTVGAVYLLEVPYIQAVGSVLLLYIAIKLLVEDSGDKHIREATSLIGAVRTIIIADFIMSLDNVLAIAAVAKGNTVLIIVGIGLSIPLIIWGSTIIMKLLDRYPIFIYLGAAILGYTAGEMILNDQKVGHFLEQLNNDLQWIIPIGGAIVVIASGLIKRYIIYRQVRSH
jgi:YjbE family integral membrane protein